MVLLQNNTFLKELTHMFQKSRSMGSVTITMKKFNGRTKPTPRIGSKPPPEPTEFYCLVRAVSRKKKIATVVPQKDINKFHLEYCSLMKGNLDGLKKLKKPKSKPKAT